MWKVATDTITVDALVRETSAPEGGSKGKSVLGGGILNPCVCGVLVKHVIAFVTVTTEEGSVAKCFDPSYQQMRENTPFILPSTNEGGTKSV
jgi:hypothetical protein